VSAVGSNNAGQLGDGTNVDKSTPIRILGVGRITQIATGFAHTLFLSANGTIFAVGSNSDGQLGDGTSVTTSTSVQVLLSDHITQITAGYGYSLFLNSNGTIYVVGSNSDGQLGNGAKFDAGTPDRLTWTNLAFSGIFSGPTSPCCPVLESIQDQTTFVLDVGYVLHQTIVIALLVTLAINVKP
jgi:hypothetical protein